MTAIDHRPRKRSACCDEALTEEGWCMSCTATPGEHEHDRRTDDLTTAACEVVQDYREALATADDPAHIEIGTYLGHSLAKLARAVDQAATAQRDGVT